MTTDILIKVNMRTTTTKATAAVQQYVPEPTRAYSGHALQRASTSEMEVDYTIDWRFAITVICRLGRQSY